MRRKRIHFYFYSICCFYCGVCVCARACAGGINQFILLIDDLISHTVAICARTGHQIILYLHNQSARCGGGASSLSVPLPPSTPLSLSLSVCLAVSLSEASLTNTRATCPVKVTQNPQISNTESKISVVTDPRLADRL